MISEFTDLSDKIDRLAELTQSLRRENATLRQSNAMLAAENEAFMTRLAQAQQRVEALLNTIPAPTPLDAMPDDGHDDDTAPEVGSDDAAPREATQ